MAIPDPPSPSKRHRRHISSPLLDVTNGGSDSSGNRQAKKRQSLGHVPSPLLLNSSSSSNSVVGKRETPKQLDLSGASFLEECKPEKVRRHSFAYAPSPVLRNGSEEKAPKQQAALDLSGAIDAYDTDELEPRKAQKSFARLSSPMLNGGQEKATIHDVSALDLAGTTGDLSIASSSSKRTLRRGSSSHFSTSASKNSRSKLDFSGVSGFDSRPPRPESASQRRKKRQSFFVTRDEDKRKESNHDGGRGLGELNLSGPDDLSVAKESAFEKKQDSCTLAEATVTTQESVSERRKKRQSFCLPSGADIENHGEDSKDAAKLESILDFSGEDSVQESVAKRRKKRQSIFLPGDSDHEDRNEVTEYFEKLAKFGSGSKEEPAAVSDDATIECDTAAGEMTTIRQLVRAYCSLPVSERGLSDEAQQIEELTSYPLVPRRVPGADVTPQEMFERTLTEMGPVIERMDRGKTFDRDLMERETGCRVEKARSGRYRYYSTQTEKRVTPSEYEEVYLKQVEKLSAEKGQVIQQWLRDFDKDVYGTDERQAETLEETVADDEDGSMATDENADKKNEACGEEGDDKKNEACREEEDDNKNEVSGEEEDDNMDISISPVAPGLEEAEQAGDEAIPIVSSTATIAPRQMLLSLPPRDTISSDPDIAEAQNKLWETIDDAVETYSRTVFAIQAANEFAESKYR